MKAVAKKFEQYRYQLFDENAVILSRAETIFFIGAFFVLGYAADTIVEIAINTGFLNVFMG